MESYKQKMKRKVRESKLRHEAKCQNDNKLGNAIIAIMTIIGGIAATVTMAILVYKCMI